jgi:hypothetical protein
MDQLIARFPGIAHADGGVASLKRATRTPFQPSCGQITDES